MFVFFFWSCWFILFILMGIRDEGGFRGVMVFFRIFMIFWKVGSFEDRVFILEDF